MGASYCDKHNWSGVWHTDECPTCYPLQGIEEQLEELKAEIVELKKLIKKDNK